MYRGADAGVDPDRLLAIAKVASDYHFGSSIPMTDAVVKAVKHEQGLGPEHVKRIVEFANNETFQRMFKKEAGDHRVFSFELAHPGDVLKEINMGITQSPVAVSDNAMAPDFIPGQDSAQGFFDAVKTASSNDSPSPVNELWRMHQRLDDLNRYLESEYIGATSIYNDASSAMCKTALDILRNGGSGTDINNVVSFYSNDRDMTKLAMSVIAGSIDVEVESGPGIKKMAGSVPNPNHPLVTAYHYFEKAAAHRFKIAAAIERVQGDLKKVNSKVAEYIR
jgi:hypothetical protein